MSSALSPSDFAALMAPLGPFEARPRVAVAVSGGADSLALALLAHDWARQRGGEAVGLTVDHGLRAEAVAEAEQVGEWLRAAGMAHHPLRWEGPKPAADIQAEARAARYRLMEEWCRGEGILHGLLAHHRDDQAETLLLRLGRGSGVDGLAAMAPVSEAFFMRWLRPLLTVPRARLAATLEVRGQGWIEDPSNRNGAYARVRVRQLMPRLAAEGMAPERLADTARRLGRARAALEDMVAKAAARWVVPHPAGFALVDVQAFRQEGEEIGLRLLSRLLQAIGGSGYPLREDRVEGLYARLCDGLGRATTLGGCRIGPLGGRLLFCREAGRVAPPLELVPGTRQCWDGRFRVETAADAPAGLRLEALGPSGWSRLVALAKPGRLPVLPAPVRPSLPVMLDQEGICAAPHLGYNRGTGMHSVVRWMVMAPASPMTAAGHCLV
ncbi:MAG TPA: tRNA lysidine(34) synthetase TilS [Magnetospirillum sp.]|jgi:tRNA(Ile)-lysidine synthase|nr:tRNA lysidine(34) synthetase TilS [Magnetospirillum sp.]